MTIECAGELIVTWMGAGVDGGVVAGGSLGVPLPPVRVTMIVVDAEIWTESVAFTVTLVTPAGTDSPAIRQFAMPSAVPDCPRSVVQVIVRLPRPPLLVPVRSTVAAAVVTAV